jgi:hypothetical protein
MVKISLQHINNNSLACYPELNELFDTAIHRSMKLQQQKP